MVCGKLNTGVLCFVFILDGFFRPSGALQVSQVQMRTTILAFFFLRQMCFRGNSASFRGIKRKIRLVTDLAFADGGLKSDTPDDVDDGLTSDEDTARKSNLTSHD